MTTPLILVSNDDGINSSGLWALVEAMAVLGDVLVVAPDRQWSCAARCRPHGVSGKVAQVSPPGDPQRYGRLVGAYAIDSSPALAVTHGLRQRAQRPVSLVVAGINYGLNLGLDNTESGTVGAAMEGAAYGIPAMAVSLGTDPAVYLTAGEIHADYRAVISYAHRFAQHVLAHGLPADVDVVNINVPGEALPETPWRLTRAARVHYYEPIPPTYRDGRPRDGMGPFVDLTVVSADSDVRAIADGIVSITPLSLDLTARIGWGNNPNLTPEPVAGWQDISGWQRA